MSQQMLSFDLDKRMLDLLAKEFDVKELVNGFADSIANKSAAEIDNVAKQVFGDYGKAWIKRSFELSEQYSDEPYEVLKAAKAKGAIETFPRFVQRVIEIAYLSTHNMAALTPVENTTRCLAFGIAGIDCSIYEALQEKCPNITDSLPCRYACLTACETLAKEMNLNVSVAMEVSVVKDGYCQFSLRRT